MTPAERAVVEAAVSRGYVSSAQVQAATSNAPAGSVLPRLSTHLSAAQREELVALYRTASQPQPGGFGTSAAPPEDTMKTRLVSPGTNPGTQPAIAPTRASPSVHRPAESGRLELGARIADFEILGELGRGGMGVVYRAKSVSLEREVALKVLVLSGIENEEGAGELVARFQVEAKAAARLRHPNIVGVLQQGKDDAGRWFMAMDLVQGESLDHSLSRDGPLLPEEGAQLILKSARALAYAHDHDVLHRDLKPHNIIVDEETGEPLITDFGLAKLVGGNQGHSLTRTGAGLLGTPAYMPPEQAESDKSRIDARGDVYSLGATLYHLLTGRPPFVGETVANILVQVVTDEPPSPRSLDPQIPVDLETICLKALEKDPNDRYASAGDLADDLERFLNNEPISALPPSFGRRLSRWVRRNQLVTALITACLVSIGITIAVALSALSGPAEPEVSPGPTVTALPPPPAKTADPEVDRLRRQLEAKERAKQAAEAKAKAAELKAKREAAAKAKAVETARAARERSAHEREQAEKAEKAAQEAEAAVAREREERMRAERERDAARKRPTPRPRPTRTPSPRATRRPTPAVALKRFGDGMDPDPRIVNGQPAPLPSWMVNRLYQLRRSRGVAWARTWREAVTEARARNVPLVVAMTRPNSGSHKGLKASKALLERAAVGLLGQGPHRMRTGEKVKAASRCPTWKTISCAQHMNTAWWVEELGRSRRYVSPEYDDGLPPSVVAHNNANRKEKRSSRAKTVRRRPPPRRPPPRGPNGRRPPPPPREPPPRHEPKAELEPAEPAERRQQASGAWPQSVKNAARLKPLDSWVVYVCRPDTLDVAHTLRGREIDAKRLEQAVVSVQGDLGAPRELLDRYLDPELKIIVGALLSAERRLESGNVSSARAVLKNNRTHASPLIRAWSRERYDRLRDWTQAWIERQVQRGPELAKERLKKLKLPNSFREARRLRDQHSR